MDPPGKKLPGTYPGEYTFIADVYTSPFQLLKAYKREHVFVLCLIKETDAPRLRTRGPLDSETEIPPDKIEGTEGKLLPNCASIT